MPTKVSRAKNPVERMLMMMMKHIGLKILKKYDLRKPQKQKFPQIFQWICEQIERSVLLTNVTNALFSNFSPSL